MIYYYFISLLIALLFWVSKKSSYLLIIILGVIFLVLIPSTGVDYDAYKHAYDNAYTISSFPWFKTNSYLTSEPFFLWYLSLISTTTSLGFSYFLALNFLLCVLLTNIFFKGIQKKHLHYFWAMMMPVIFLTIFYWSPRSSLSFILIIGGFILLIKERPLSAILSLFCGCMIHSQFLLITVLIIITYIIFAQKRIPQSAYIKIILLLCIALYVFLMNLDSLTSALRSILSFLPSGTIISSKMGYFERESEGGLRLTAILSVIVYPLLSYYLIRFKNNNADKTLFFYNNEQDYIFVYMLYAVIAYGMVTNISFWGNPHVAGRLSRFSDYIGMGILIPTFFSTVTKDNIGKIILLFFCIIAPIIYKTLYSGVQWGL